MRSLSFWHVLGQLLELDVLFVSELAQVVHKLQGGTVSAMTTLSGFLNLRVLQNDLRVFPTMSAPEQSLFHFRIYLRTPNNYPSKADQTVDVARPQILDLSQFIKILDSHHKTFLLQQSLGFVGVVDALVQDEELLVESLERVVEQTDHFGGKVDELVVEFAVVLLQMSALHLENVPFRQLQVVQLIPVDLLSHRIAIDQAGDFEVHDEVLQTTADVLHRNVGAINHAGLVTCK
jgi:hypothetical protein